MASGLFLSFLFGLATLSSRNPYCLISSFLFLFLQTCHYLATSFIAVSKTYFVRAQINVVKMHNIPNKSNAPPTDPAIIGIGSPSPVPSVAIKRKYYNS